MIGIKRKDTDLNDFDNLCIRRYTKLIMWSILAAAVATAPHSHKASGKIGWEHQQWHAAVDRHLYNSK